MTKKGRSQTSNIIFKRTMYQGQVKLENLIIKIAYKTLGPDLDTGTLVMHHLAAVVSSPLEKLQLAKIEIMEVLNKCSIIRFKRSETKRRK